MNWKKIDIYLLMLLTTLALFSLYKIIFENYDSTLKTKKTVLATISGQINTVKKKRAHFLAWTDAHLNDKLSYNDRIYTHANSQSTLTLKNSTNIVLLENTLIQIGSSKNKADFHLEKGLLKVRLIKDTISLHLKNKSIKLQSKNAEILIVKDENKTKIDLIKGQINIIKSNKLLKLKEKQYISIDNNSNENIIGIRPIVLQYPTSGQILYMKNQKNITLKWGKSQKINKKVIIELSSNKKFTKIFSKIKTIKSKFQYLIKNKGPVYWRVRQSLKENKYMTGYFQMAQIPIPTIHSPINKRTFHFQDLSKNTLNSVIIKWNKHFSLTTELEILSPNNQQQQIISKSNTFKIDNLIWGKYIYQARFISPEGVKSNWSKSRTFKIFRPPLPNIPEIISPKDDQDVIFYNKNAMPITFKWKINQLLKNNYQLIILKDNKQIVKTSVSKHSYDWNIPSAGHYSLKIRAINQYSMTSPYSKTINFFVILANQLKRTPEHGVKIILKRPDQKINFKWQKNNSDDIEYIFELSKDDQFNKPVMQKKTKNQNIDIVIHGAGTYNWRVKTKQIEEDNHIKETRFSIPLKVIVEPIPPPTKPLIPEMQNLKIRKKQSTFINKIFNLFFPAANAANFFTVLKWEKKEDVKSYLVEIYKEEQLQNLILKKQIQENKLEWMNPPIGTFFWRLAYIDYWDRQGPFSKLSKIDVSLENKSISNTQLLLKAPSHKKQIIINKRDEIQFSWQEVQNAQSYELLISKNLEFSKIIFSIQTNENYFSLPHTKLPLGNYYWRIVAKGIYIKKALSKRRLLTLKKKIIKSSLKTESKPIITKSIKHNFLLIGYAPSIDKYEIDSSSFDSQIKGTTKFSFFTNSYIEFAKNWSTHLNFFYKSGKTFNDQKWKMIDAIIQSGYNFFTLLNIPLTFKLGIIYNKLGIYQLSSNNFPEYSSKKYISFIPAFTLNFSLPKNFNALFDLGIGFGGINLIFIDATIKKMLTKSIFIISGINYFSKKFKENSQEININELRILLGAGFYF